MGVSIARISQIEHGEVTSIDVIGRYVEALGGHLDLVADFGDHTMRLPVSDRSPGSQSPSSALGSRKITLGQRSDRGRLPSSG
ncbi:helix-turn-helix domain-containing protein [Actinomadura alba]|uniref:helix-turn-helix domain-containing protein n=1 Tax=Actinomadura alba TaxID=406431 RepID=UPI001C9C4CBC|nr:helix-turn-helix transcriptional regulator [Actinomadura alba]